MFIDARTQPDRTNIDADVCIIGAGAAGITIARELARTSAKVVVLESGGFELDDRTQSLYEGANVGIPSFDLEINRLRYFGGTTNHWAGHCRPLEEMDFERRRWRPASGWPISRKELEPYYPEAERICQLSAVGYGAPDAVADRLGLSTLPLDKARLQTVLYKQSPPTRFGQVYRDDLRRAETVHVYLHATALELRTNREGTVVTSVRVACINGPSMSVTARVFVLATGGMENARLLLLSNGLGNGRDLVGRYFQDHVLLRPGAVMVFSPSNVDLCFYHDLHSVEEGQVFGVLTPSQELVWREEIGNFRIHLVRPIRGMSLGMGSLRWVKRAVRRGGRLDAFMGHLENVLSDLDGIASSTYDRIFKGGTTTKARNVYASIELHLVIEPVPNRDSCITLSSSQDLFGQNRLAVNWQLGEPDLKTARRAIELAGLEFGRMGLGRVYGAILEDETRWPDNLEAGRHHCGTTRMADNPKDGVVDRDCRVHGVDNLYIAGSSVFPTIGYANPTLTIVALSLRITNHIRNRMGWTSDG